MQSSNLIWHQIRHNSILNKVKLWKTLHLQSHITKEIHLRFVPEKNSFYSVVKHFYCDKCDSKIFKKQINMKHPITIVHQDEIECRICDKKFGSTMKTIKHMDEHMQE